MQTLSKSLSLGKCFSTKKNVTANKIAVQKQFEEMEMVVFEINKTLRKYNYAECNIESIANKISFTTEKNNCFPYKSFEIGLNFKYLNEKIEFDRWLCDIFLRSENIDANLFINTINKKINKEGYDCLFDKGFKKSVIAFLK